MHASSVARAHAPPCTGGDAVDDGAPQLVDHFRARHDRRGQRLEPARVVAVDVDAGRHRPDVAALAADEHVAEVLVRGRRAVVRRHVVGAAVAACGLERGLGGRVGHLAQPAAGAAVRVGALRPAHLADAVHLLVAVVVRVAVNRWRSRTRRSRTRAARCTRPRSAAPGPSSPCAHARSARRRRPGAARCRSGARPGCRSRRRRPRCAIPRGAARGTGTRSRRTRAASAARRARRWRRSRGARAMGASKLWLWPTTSCRRARAAASIIARAVVERHRHRLLDQHVLAVRERRARVRGVDRRAASRRRRRRRSASAHSASTVS